MIRLGGKWRGDEFSRRRAGFATYALTITGYIVIGDLWHDGSCNALDTPQSTIVIMAGRDIANGTVINPERYVAW